MHIFQKKTIYDRKCPNCKLTMYVNSESKRDKVEDINISNYLYEFNEKEKKYYKCYRSALCLNCQTDYNMNFKIKHYCFFGLFCWKIENLYKSF